MAAQSLVDRLPSGKVMTDDTPIQLGVRGASGSPLSGATVTGDNLPSGTVTDNDGSITLSYGLPDPPSNPNALSFSYSAPGCSYALTGFVDIEQVDPITLSNDNAVFIYNLRNLAGLDPQTGLWTPSFVLGSIANLPNKSLTALLQLFSIGSTAVAYSPQTGDTLYQQYRTVRSVVNGAKENYEYVAVIVRAGQPIYKQVVWSADAKNLPGRSFDCNAPGSVCS
jgi:hypothetical protein